MTPSRPIGIGPREVPQPFLAAYLPRVPGLVQIRCKGETPHIDEAMAMAHHQRWLACLAYADCLDQAVTAGWHGWDCMRCGIWRARRNGP